MVTIKDIAERAKVSVSTVSYVINGTRSISAEIKELVLRTMKEMNYKPNPLARALAGKKTRFIGLIFDPPERGLGITEITILSCAAEAAKALDYHLVLLATGSNNPDKLAELANQRMFDGFILMEILEHDPRVDYLSRQEIPFVMIGRCGDAHNAIQIDVDFSVSAELGLKHLQELGHREILFINQSREVYRSGYGAAIRAQEAVLETSAALELVCYTRFCRSNNADGKRVFTAMKEQHPGITAVVMLNDQALPGVMQAVNLLGLSIPEDISLLPLLSSGKLAEMFIPALTTVEIPSRVLGNLGVEKLVAFLEQKNVTPNVFLVPGTLQVRGSTGPCQGR